ncbi:GDSL esterase/lipase [Rhynchospora pubera]|uniref:GDSL esterase/lipase n=1 Tax=Rhynchospora pubera TaxID=906938 RepID=A0AAV8ES84_9POAL|nr:GDSL esterase/lipase [Rhynchospora pubera]
MASICTYNSAIIITIILLLLKDALGMVPAVYVFGDSLADVGNNNHLQLSLLKANYPHNGVDYPGRKATGRFSNGKNFADFLAQNLGVETSPPYLSLPSKSNNTSVYLTGVNFASGGAGILNTTNSGACIRFDQQIDYYSAVYGVIVQQLGTTQAQDHLSKSVFAIVIGSNELLNYAKSNSASKASPQQFVDSLIPTLQGQLKRIYNLGARKFVLIGTGPIGCCPALREQNKTKECNAEGNSASVLYNKAVSSLLNEMRRQYSDMSYSFVDTSIVLNQYIQQPSAYGFTEVKSACCGLGDLNAKVACLPVSTYCSNRSSHIFWDFYHPTEATARMVVATAFDGSAPSVYPVNIRQLAS